MTETSSEKSVVKSAGRGVIFITLAKAWFMVTGWAMYFILPRLFEWTSGGDAILGQRLYGLYMLVFTGVSIINNGIITGTLQSVSKFTAEKEGNAYGVRRTAFLVMGGVGLLIAGIYAGGADLIAVHALKSTDSQLPAYIRLSSCIIVAYACYAVFIGSLNGRRLFGRQAMFDIAYATLKTGAIIAFVVAGFKVLGTVMGFLLAATVIAIVAGIVSRVPGKGRFSGKRFLSYAWVLLLYTFVLNLLMMFDLFMLSALVPRMAVESGLTEAVASAQMELRAGQYGAIQRLAFIPFQGTIAIGLVVFPLISKVASEKDAAKIKSYVQKALRFTLIFIVGFAVVFAAVSKGAILLVYKDSYAVGENALRILPFGICALGLMSISNNILNAVGLKWQALAVVLAGFIALLGFDYLFISMAGTGESVLRATAIGTSLGMGVALGLSGYFVYRRFGTFWPWATVIRVGLAAAIAVIAGYFMPEMGKVATLGECLVVFAIYFVSLAVLREFKSEDLSQLKQVIGRS